MRRREQTTCRARAGRLLHPTRVDTHKAAVARAAELAGGVKALSVRLRVPVVDLMRWIQGEAKPSRGVFLRLVDFVIEEGRRASTPPPAPAHKPVKPAKIGRAHV